ncbi:hypothetical protein AMATHDRAFT_48943 [Amanita thiersii Skay4041]|uniref:Uncharacterized protein n=1 Tax=Amanita thiersii Skay4041 TaxID=703135 RepID=A0A2A9NLI5_9AGAR|nr:hypothetical protein AMATHDRAFT_48943 [Amanita thiersii Skay4041]
MSWADIFSLLAYSAASSTPFSSSPAPAQTSYKLQIRSKPSFPESSLPPRLTKSTSLKSKGYDISKTGVSVKTSKRFDHEHYVDAVQRGFIRALGASSYGANGDSGSQERRPRPERSNSLSNVTSPYRPSAPVVGHVALPVKRSTSAEAKKRWVHPFLHEKS